MKEFYSSKGYAHPSSPASSLPDGQLVSDWNRLALDLAQAASRGPTISSRLYALTNTALYDAWAAFDPMASGSIMDLSVTPHGKGQPLMAATMAQAAHDVLIDIGASLFGSGGLPANLRSRADVLLDQTLGTVRGSSRSRPHRRSVELGRQIGAGILSWAGQDGSNQAGNYSDTTGYRPQPSRFDPSAVPPQIDTTWQPLVNALGSPQLALTPQWGRVKPFAIGSGDALVPSSILQPYLSNHDLNPAFLKEVNQVLTLSGQLSAKQKAMAEFWEQGPGTTFPPGKWMEFSLDLIANRHLTNDQAVKLCFGVSQALLDAGIAAWATKFTYDSVRPITVIRQLYKDRAVTDWRGIPLLGSAWQPYQNPKALTPNFPDVPSGHSTFSAAASGVIRELLGSNLFGASVTFNDADSRFDSRGFDGVSGIAAPISLNWDTLSGAAEEAGFSRLLGGIHFSDGNWKGLMMGTQVAALTTAKLQDLFDGNKDSADLGSHSQNAADQVFGTMDNDVLTGQRSGGGGVVQLYGFSGDDLLNGGGQTHRRYELFGGEGYDRFYITGKGDVLVRDFEAGESILFDPQLLVGGGGLAGLVVSNQDDGQGRLMTELVSCGTTLLSVDGFWSRDNLSIGLA